MAGGTDDTRSDVELLHAHTRGDPAAFAVLVNRHRAFLWNIALRAAGNPEDAADALQEALLSAHRTARSFRADALVTSWLHRIIVNAAIDRRRREALRRTVPFADHDTALFADPIDHYDRSDTVHAVNDALDDLPPAQRDAIIAVDIEGYSVDEAAKRLGVPNGTVKSRCSRARVRLAAALGHLRRPDP
ncbi:MAG: RNA polymerase sigma factor SigM [Gordonia sp. (in: high G+C Gram-positive bacteria)]